MEDCETCHYWSNGKGSKRCGQCSVWKKLMRNKPSIRAHSFPQSAIESFADNRQTLTLLEAITKLEPIEALCIFGKYLMNMKNQELALLLKLHKRTIERRISQARAALLAQKFMIGKEKED